MESPPAGGAGDTHLDYLRRLLAGAGEAPGGEFRFLTRAEGIPGFWELIGFRVNGLSRALLGAVHFQAQSDDPFQFARRSLGHFLSSPPQNLGVDRDSYPADLIELRVPPEGEDLPDLLGRLRRGDATASLYLDAAHLEIAFDFRRANPSIQRLPGEQSRSRRLLFRSREGHVLVGNTLNLGAKLRRTGSFLALTAVRQHLPARTLELPTLVVHRDFLTMIAETAGADPEGSMSLPGAFSPQMANPFHLLDPRLDTGPAHPDAS